MDLQTINHRLQVASCRCKWYGTMVDIIAFSFMLWIASLQISFPIKNDHKKLVKRRSVPTYRRQSSRKIMSIREVILVLLFLVVVSTANTADTSTTAKESSSSVVDDVIRFLRGGGNRQLGRTPAAPKWVPTKQPTKLPTKQPSKLPTRSPTISVSLQDVLLTTCVHFLSH